MNEDKPVINSADEAICDKCIHSGLNWSGKLICHCDRGEVEIPYKEFSCDKGKWQIKESIGEGNTISPRFENDYGYPGRMILFGGNPELSHYTGDPNAISFSINLKGEEDEEMEGEIKSQEKWEALKEKTQTHIDAIEAELKVFPKKSTSKYPKINLLEADLVRLNLFITWMKHLEEK